MLGLNQTDGSGLSGVDHLRQSIMNILTTPIGSRVMRRDFGSRLFELIDSPLDGQTQVSLIAATAQALDQWEPRFSLSRVSVASGAPGVIVLDLVGTYIPEGREITLPGIYL
ncbi:MAG: GPW/gp25 family protein [Candidatus Thiodiazotropha sp. (ex Dulcina madagascariensis)]|nr:GPW/gp25 family protein [Candidatus Thiodiazotropha sp. (ex Dulcina madagascariensis)]